MTWTDRLALFLVALVAGAALGAAIATWVNVSGLRHELRCTHGASSIGPMTITGSRPTGSTTPHTETCLP